MKAKILILIAVLIVGFYCDSSTEKAKECRSVTEATKSNCEAKGDSSVQCCLQTYSQGGPEDKTMCLPVPNTSVFNSIIYFVSKPSWDIECLEDKRSSPPEMTAENEKCSTTELFPDTKDAWKSLCNSQNSSKQKCCLQNITLNGVVNNNCIPINNFADYKTALDELYPGFNSIDCSGNLMSVTIMFIALLALLLF